MSFFGRIRNALRRLIGRVEPVRPTPGEPFDYQDHEGVDTDNGAYYRVVRWGDYGSWKTLDSDRPPTWRAIADSEQFVIEYTYPDGTVVYRTFRTPVESLQRTIDYWKSIDSL